MWKLCTFHLFQWSAYIFVHYSRIDQNFRIFQQQRKAFQTSSLLENLKIYVMNVFKQNKTVHLVTFTNNVMWFNFVGKSCLDCHVHDVHLRITNAILLKWRYHFICQINQRKIRHGTYGFAWLCKQMQILQKSIYYS